MQTPSVSIIILQYNNSQDTIRCLNSVKELDYPNYYVIVVDNGSEIKHFNEITDWFKKEQDSYPHTSYQILNTKYNLGYSGGNNIGIKYAMENNADYVLILNNDTQLEQNSVSELVNTCQKNDKIGIVEPIIEENGKKFYGGEIKWLHPELKHLETEQEANLYIPGMAMLISRSVIEKIGLLDERYFLYFEDADYSVNISRAGYKLRVIKNTFVRHSSQATTKKLGSAILLRYHYRNSHLFNWKNGPLWVKIALPFWSIFITLKQLTKLVLIPSKREISRAILAGVIDFYKNKFGKINA